ncbi:MAG: hypothetical protein ACK4UV_09160 [Ignavibacterium sp.]
MVRSERERKIGAADFKSQKRTELTDKGYEIIICVGVGVSNFIPAGGIK